MTKQRSMGSGATASKGLLPRTVATVTITYRAVRLRTQERPRAQWELSRQSASVASPAGLIGTSGPIERMVSHPPQPHPTYSPSVPRRLTEYATAKGLNVAQTPKNDAERPRKKVQRHSPDRLLCRPVQLDGGVTVSAELHKGRIVVRVEEQEGR